MAAGEDLLIDRVLDVDCSKAWGGKALPHCPCLTRSRARGLWILSRGRRMRPEEALRLQGVDPELWCFEMTSSQQFAAAGNSMSVNVIRWRVLAFLVAMALLPRRPGRDPHRCSKLVMQSVNRFQLLR